MAEKTPREIQALLAQPFAPEDIEWRLQVTLKDQLRGTAIPYVTNRAIQSRLDDVVGPENWHNEFKPWHGVKGKEAQICGISIYFEGRGWIQKWDGAEDSDIEPVKGGLSDSMKRAAVQWGVGRVLYSMDETIWVSIETRGQSYVIKDSERPRLDKAYLDLLKRLGLTHAEPIGTQAELAPKRDTALGTKEPTAEKNQQKPAAPPSEQQFTQDKQQAPSPIQRVERQKTPEPQYEYVVTNIAVQSGMSGKSTSLELTDREGKKTKLFAKGEPAGLVFGAKLVNVKYSMRQQNTVAFNFLESFDVVTAPARQAA
jgi:hypothetical protein